MFYRRYEVDCFGESKRSLKSLEDEHKRDIRNCDYDMNETVKHCWEADHNFSWDQNKVVDRESRLIPRKIKETIHTFFTFFNLYNLRILITLKYGFLIYVSSYY